MAAVHATTSALINALDFLNLRNREVDRFTPFLSSVVEALNRHAWLPAEERARMLAWKRTLGAMRASDDLSEEQARQLCFDLETTHDNFRAALATK